MKKKKIRQIITRRILKKYFPFIHFLITRTAAYSCNYPINQSRGGGTIHNARAGQNILNRPGFSSGHAHRSLRV